MGSWRRWSERPTRVSGGSCPPVSCTCSTPPVGEEIAWARENASSDEHLLGLVIQLKAFSRLGYFPALDEVPAEVVGHIRRDLRLPETTRPHYASVRTPSGTAT